LPDEAHDKASPSDVPWQGFGLTGLGAITGLARENARNAGRFADRISNLKGWVGMDVGIRKKMVALLTGVALVPLIAALLTIVIGSREVATSAAGRQMLLTALAESVRLESLLGKDIEKLEVALQYDESVPAALAACDKALKVNELADLDAGWAALPETAPPLKEILASPIARKLRRMQQDAPYVAEVLVTDRFGQLQAATEKTSDYYQADEDWWRQAFADGRGKIYVPPVQYDQSAGLWSINVCMPIIFNDEVVGVAKAVLDISNWVRYERTVGDERAELMIVQRDGKIVSRADTVPLTAGASAWDDAIGRAAAPGWRLTPDGRIQGYAPAHFEVGVGALGIETPRWIVVASMGRSEALGEVYWLSGVALAIGAAVVAGLFAVGLLLVDRSLVRRIVRLARATRRVSRGDFEHRISLKTRQRRLLGSDEIDQLFEDFNRMVERIQSSHRQLMEANDLKMDFIRIAGHELRTPVGYIMGMTRLANLSRDPERLAKAVGQIRDKAERLSDILMDMFKLLPEQRYAELIDYCRVPITKLLEDVLADVQPFAEQRRQRVKVEAHDAPEVLECNRPKMIDVLVNLLMNAVKFTPDGGCVLVTVGRQLGGYVSFKVTDEGSGIPKSELPRVFDAFFTGGDVLQHSTGTSGHGKRGMGLGLAVVKHFVKLHGGDVQVTSTQQGCTFAVSIPEEPPARKDRPRSPVED